MWNLLNNIIMKHMKAILEFDLNDFDDQIAHKRAVKSLDLALAIWQIVHNTKREMGREIERALDQDKNFTPYDSLDILFDHIHDVLNEHHISIDELVV